MAPVSTATMAAVASDGEARVLKRHKTDKGVGGGSSGSGKSGSRLYAPFRALGFITTAVAPALAVRRGGKDASQPDVSMVTCLGNAWAMWGLNHGMPLLFVGPALQEPIRALAITQSPDSVLALSGTMVWQYVRGKLVAVFDTADEQRQADWDDDNEDAPKGTRLGPALLTFADFVIALSEAGDKLFVWSLLNHTLLRVIHFPTTETASAAASPFTAINMEHPATYLNKIIVTSAQGGAQLWNVRTGSLIHAFDPAKLHALAGVHAATATDDDRKLVAVVQTPAVDILAFGYSSGHILLHDIRRDQPILRARVQDGIPSPHVKEDLAHKRVSQEYALVHDIQGATRPISFRTDGVAQSMAVGTRAGTVAVFDLESDGLDALDELLTGTGDASRADPETLLAAQQAGAHVRGARLAQTIRNAHDDAVPVAYAEFMPGQPLLLTAAGDNKLRQWFFEPAAAATDGQAVKAGAAANPAQGGGVPRLLKHREGHHAPPVLIRHYGEDGKNILSAGLDKSLRCISVVRDSRSYELSQGALQKKSTALSLPLSSLKLPPATDIAFSTTRSRDWDDVLTAHSGSATAHTWTVRDKRMGQGYLTTSPQAPTSEASLPAKKGKPKSGPAGANRRLAFGTDAHLPAATAVHVSACGNFGLVGGYDGKVQMWNMQSYLWRKTFDAGAPVGAKAASPSSASATTTTKTGASASAKRAITGVTSDALNRLVIASTAEGKLVFFDFASTKVLHRLSIPVPASPTGGGGQGGPVGVLRMRLHTDSSLLGVLCADAHVRLYDVSTYRLVRDFVCGPRRSQTLTSEGVGGGEPTTLSDLAFSPDGRWLVVSASDGKIRTFDLPSGHLIDVFATPSRCTSLSFSPRGDFLATAHEGSVGVYLWLNRGVFGHVAIRSIDEEQEEEAEAEAEAGGADGDRAKVALPTVQGVVEDEELARLADEAGLDAGEPDLQRTFYTSPPQLFEILRPSSSSITGSEGADKTTLSATTTRRPLITLSTMPRSRWMTLLNLDAIKARNRPREKPKAPERAPFFLPQLAGGGSAGPSGLEAGLGAEDGEKEVVGTEAGTKGTKTSRRIVGAGGLEVELEMVRRLRTAVESGKHGPLFQYLHALSPPALDAELRSLHTAPELTLLLRALTMRLQAHVEYEAVQALVGVVVRVHGDVLLERGVRGASRRRGRGEDASVDKDEDEDEQGQEQEEEEQEGRALAEAVRLLLLELHAEAGRVMELLDYCLGSLSLIRDLPLV